MDAKKKRKQTIQYNNPITALLKEELDFLVVGGPRMCSVVTTH
jgi:hypothetical protein